MMSSAAADQPNNVRVEKKRLHQLIDRLSPDQLADFTRSLEQSFPGSTQVATPSPKGGSEQNGAGDWPARNGARDEADSLKLIDDLPGMIWRSGTDGRCVYLNQTWLAFTGRTFTQELGFAWVDGVHPEDRDQVLKKYREALETRQPFELEYRLRNAADEYCWIMDIGRPVHDRRGQFSGFIGIRYDLTARRNVEKALRDSEMMFKGLFENSPDAVVVVSSKGKIQLANQKALEMFGYSLQELQSMNVELLMPGVYREQHRSHVAEFVASPRVREMGGQYLSLYAQRKDGSLFPVDITLGPLKIESEMIVLATIRDVSHRKEIEQALVKSEARFHKIFSESVFGIVLLDPSGNIVEANPALAEMLKSSAEDLIGKPHTGIVHPEDTAISREILAKMITGGETRTSAELRYLAKDGSLVWAKFSGSLFRGDGRNSLLILGMIENATGQKQVEAELAEVQRRLIDSAENERLLLSQELHDGPIQDLQAMSIQLAEAGLEESRPNWQETVTKLSEEVSQVTQSLRAICGDLRPPTLAPFGLEKAIRSHLQQTQEKNPGVRFEADLMPDRNTLSERVRLALFRIYQHAVTNSLRHAQADHILVRFGFDEDEIRLEIRDNGKGFSLPKRWVDLVRKGHFGLVGAMERAESVGGRMRVETRPGAGTAILVTLPRREAYQITARERFTIQADIRPDE